MDYLWQLACSPKMAYVWFLAKMFVVMSVSFYLGWLEGRDYGRREVLDEPR